VKNLKLATSSSAVKNRILKSHDSVLTALEEVISEISEFYLQKNDPIEKALRAKIRAKRKGAKKKEAAGIYCHYLTEIS